MKEHRKGYTLMIDALIALIFMLIIITTIYSISFSRNAKSDIMSFKELHYVSEDVLDVLNKNGVLDNVSTNWAANSSRASPEMIAANLTAREYLEQMLPPGIGYNLTIEEGALSSTIAASNSSRPSLKDSSTGTHSTRVLVGYGAGKPTLSYSSRAALNALSSSIFSRYIYFGGFEGQGNITKFIDLPDDAVITDAHMQLNPGANFRLYVNKQFVNSYAGAGASLTASDIALTAYKNFFTGGRNWITLNFTQNKSNFVGGGYLRVDYTTSKWNELPDLNTYWFPGIKGLINLYSSFYAPGKMADPGMKIYLHYRHNISGGVNVYLKIANYTVYQNSTTGERKVNLTWATIVNKVGCGANANCAILKLSNKTIPFKFGTDTFVFSTGGQGTADAVLITDVSGSMADCKIASTTTCDCFGPCQRNKINVAKEVDKVFVTKMLDYTGTRVGLVSYRNALSAWRGLTSNESSLNASINAYTASDSTCVSCGVNKALQILNATYRSLVSSRSSWKYNKSYSNSSPPDAGNNSWKSRAYTGDSGWSSGNAILGFENPAYTPNVNTNIGDNIIFSDSNLFDMAADVPAPVDFNSGLNSTANTFGPNAGNDGWDWDKQQYGGAATTYVKLYDHNNPRKTDQRTTQSIVAIELYRSGGTIGGHRGAAFGIQFQVTAAQYAKIVAGASAIVSFQYSFDDLDDNLEETACVKGRLRRGAGAPADTLYLGAETDPIGGGNAVWCHTGYPQEQTNTVFSQDVRSFINGAGSYYLDFGCNLQSTTVGTEGVNCSFDNIRFATVEGGNYFFRKHFNVTDLSKIASGLLFVLSDDNAEVYLNGVLVDNETSSHNAAYWNRAVVVDKSRFFAGDNVLAVKLRHKDSSAAKFDLGLMYTNESRKRAMLVMSDGLANTLIDTSTSTDGDPYAATVEAVNKACAARDYNISVYSVAFGSDADPKALKKIACWDCRKCDPGDYTADVAPASCWLPKEGYNNCSKFFSGNNASALSKIYATIAQQIANASLSLQMINITFGSVSRNNTIYPDSYMKFYTTSYPTLSEDESPLTVESAQFNNAVSNGSFTVPAMTRPIDAKVTSYSGAYWTKSLRVKNNTNPWQTVYNLTTFGAVYDTLGDPYIVNIPVAKIGTGTNYAEMKTGAGPSDNHGGSLQDKVIYILAIKMLSAYSQPQKTNEGCNWTVQFFDGTTAYVPAPYGYSGPRKCSYNSSTYTAKKYDNSSAVNEAVYNLFKQLDSNPYNGRLDVKFNPKDIVIDTTTVGGVRSLWGPVRLKLTLWM